MAMKGMKQLSFGSDCVELMLALLLLGRCDDG
jgi:hypothetical protein